MVRHLKSFAMLVAWLNLLLWLSILCWSLSE